MSRRDAESFEPGGAMPACVLALGLIWAAAAGSGCSESEDSLSGSVGQIYDLSFQSTRARLYTSEFALEYVRRDGQTPVRIIVERSPDRTLSTGTVDLTERGTIIGRVDDRSLPEFDSGELILEEYRTVEGEPVRGSFDATHRSGETEYTLNGDFATTQTFVDGSLGYEYRDGGDARALDAGIGGDVDESEGEM